MRLTADEVRHIAALARVGMTEDEIQRMGEEMYHILKNFDVLDQVDTDGVEPTGHSVELTSVMRDDEATESLPIDDMLANAPAREEDLIRIRAVLE
jgi:aspartyl-tRNA(Asn)/glutamyl-tRNA(Gln) amidotransferase subunit C